MNETSTFRDMRYFSEMMRTQGYPRIISLESFKKPNFELVAEILDWLAFRFDPNAEVPENISDSDNRVKFMQSVTSLFVTKARIKVSPVNLYYADYHAVPELIKIASLLYNVYTTDGMDGDLGSRHTFTLPAKYNRLSTKTLATEITETGHQVYDQLGKEGQQIDKRNVAIKFIDELSKNFTSDSGNENQYIQKCVNDLIKEQTDNIEEMMKYEETLKEDERSLEEKIKRKTLEIQRAENKLNRYKNGGGNKNPFTDEMERLEKDIEKVYSDYLDRFRNLDYLEHKVDQYNELEKEKTQLAKDNLMKMQQKIREDEDKMLTCDGDRDDFNGPMGGKMGKKIHMQGNLDGGEYNDAINEYD